MSVSANGTHFVSCPICTRRVPAGSINTHLDSKDCVPPTDGAASTSSSPIQVAPSSSAKPTPQFKPKASASLKRPSSPPPAPEPPRKARRPAHVLAAQPLAERLRPTTLDEYVGQANLLDPETGVLRALIEEDRVGSCIFWGPPGTGKTTLARLIAKETKAVFKEISATNTGTGEVKGIFDEAKNTLQLMGRRTILFCDEIHRYNKSQQDIFLPYVENGSVQLIGATTENPSFKVNGALLSRCRVYTLSRLSPPEILLLLTNALSRYTASLPPSNSSSSTFSPSAISPALLTFLSRLSDGDARVALNALELALNTLEKRPSLGEDELMGALKRGVVLRYDRTGDSHYDMISAMHKSIRGGDADAALYWVMRMITAGEDPLYIARRMIVVASEDVGMADSHALPLATATFNACQMIGLPECKINLSHCAVYLSEAPKSIRVYRAMHKAEAAALEGSHPVPMHIRNAPTSLMKDLGYAKGYLYTPSYAHPTFQEYLPPEIEEKRFLLPEGSTEDKEWDEDALREWEERMGRRWEGRDEFVRTREGMRKVKEEGAGGG